MSTFTEKLLTTEEFSKLSVTEQQQYLCKIVSQLSDEEVKRIYFAMKEDPDLQKYF